MKREVAELYSFFIRKLYKNKSYTFFEINLTNNHKRSLIDFLSLLIIKVPRYEIDKEYMFDYCAFQFQYLHSKVPRYKENRVPFNQIFNKKALSRWLTKNEGYMYYVNETLIEKGIYKSEIIKEEVKLVKALDIIDGEEREKIRFLNKENGFAHCLISTSLFNHKSDNCSRCNSKGACKLVLKDKMFAIYIDRGYDVQKRVC